MKHLFIKLNNFLLKFQQCFSHRYLGWKINVVDHCENGQESVIEEVFTKPDDVVAEPSINFETKLLPNENFLQKHEKDLIKHHNMNESPPKFSIDYQKNSEIHKLIAEGIKTAEALEESILKNSSYAVLNPSEANFSTSIDLSTDNVKENSEAHNSSIDKIPKNQVKLLPGRPMISPSGLPLFLRPPSGLPYNQAYNKPLNLPVRRPIAHERRPVNRIQRPYLLPQSSIIVNQYKKPAIHMGMRNKPQMKPQTSIMLLGEPTEIKPFKKNVEIMHTKSHFENMPKLKKNDAIMQRPSKLAIKKERYPNISSFNDPFQIHNDSAAIRTAQNTGFKGDSVVFEKGFKPIYRREDVININDESSEIIRVSNRRRDDFVSDIDEAIESEVLLINNDQPVNSLFEPMFIPSPLESVALPQVNKSRINPDMQIEDGEDKIAEGNERQDYFYLPPNSKNSKLEIVAFDGKAVLDTSLLNSDPVIRNDFALSSKTREFIRDTPQFGKFKGEIPKEIITQLNSESSDYSDRERDRNPISTKLSVIK